ncbi:(2Fe-2S)-binding protein [Clostridium sp. LIBA-8841]|uniref:(2Fe-2S)-binding protein n=1 Tax=Clostridium sp. LIBA-8841 TaxID=2987530 RepID=UPI002AC6E2AC|nr:(2Fe-2S)-binding protein [Clostridium sp. LIBA-8841]MDZ5254731.1 (2Fe-2S)-binding protein [Clostridium sp. LIBA-8841]
MTDNNNLNQQVIDKMTKVCICRAISRAKIKEAIKNGAHTVEAVAEVTGATKGSCRGCRCRDKIEELIEDNQ